MITRSWKQVTVTCPNNHNTSLKAHLCCYLFDQPVHQRIQMYICCCTCTAGPRVWFKKKNLARTSLFKTTLWKKRKYGRGVGDPYATSAVVTGHSVLCLLLKHSLGLFNRTGLFCLISYTRGVLCVAALFLASSQPSSSCNLTPMWVLCFKGQHWRAFMAVQASIRLSAPFLYS